MLVGAWNTLFGYASFALLTVWLGRYIPASYMVASLFSSLLNITVAFVGYKWFVFKTRGNVFSEWARCVMVYSGGIALGLAMLPPAVLLVAHVTGDARKAPYVAGAVVMGVQIVVGFVGHRRFSFRDVPGADASGSGSPPHSPRS